jgi:hypothetical protein
MIRAKTIARIHTSARSPVFDEFRLGFWLLAFPAQEARRLKMEGLFG